MFGDESQPARGIAYPIADAADGPAQLRRFRRVDLTGTGRARLARSFWSVRGLVSRAEESHYRLRLRLNGHAYHDIALSAEELALLANGQLPAATAPVVDAPLSDLVAGTNTIEFVTAGVPQGYAPGVANVDLIVSP